MYHAAHDHRGWYVVNAEGRCVTEPHPDQAFTRDRAESLNMARERREQRGEHGEPQAHQN